MASNLFGKRHDPGYWSLLVAVIEVAKRDAAGTGPCFSTMGQAQQHLHRNEAQHFLEWCAESLVADPQPGARVRGRPV